MERVASGGELSRIALALKTCLVGSSSGSTMRTLVFDEIDTGIGGRAAEGVARRLKALAAENQVVCVTHLAQIACFADHHYRVGKFERAGRTVAEIEELDAQASTEEIGRMLSGQILTPRRCGMRRSCSAPRVRDSKGLKWEKTGTSASSEVKRPIGHGSSGMQRRRTTLPPER